MEPTDLTIEILEGIREENRKTNAELGELRTEMRKGLGELRDRQTATEVRLATELIGVAGAVRSTSSSPWWARRSRS